MKVTKTIELSNDERETLEKALSLIDQIADVVDDTMESVFEYFVVNSDPTEGKGYYVKSVHDITEMR
jgi:hypothetical protein